MPLEERKEFDIGLPVLTPTLVRKKSLAEEIAALDVMAFQTMLLPLSADDPQQQDLPLRRPRHHYAAKNR